MNTPAETFAAPAQTGLTLKQRACLDAIEAHLARTRAMPSVEDLRVALGAGSKAGVLRLLRQLEERGRIARQPHRACAIRLLPAAACPRCGEPLACEAQAA
ncbi:MAG: LexA family protein [Rhizomicrobium sp.]